MVSAQATEADSISVPPVTSHPTPVITVLSDRQLELESQVTANLPHNGGTLLPGNQEADLQGSTTQVSLSDAEESLAKVRLTEAAKVRTRSYSGGMRRRLSVAIALIGNPKLAILDEPV